MPSKVNLMLHVAFFPIKDLLFAHNLELVEVARKVHQNENKSPSSSYKLRSKLYPALLTLCRSSTLDQIDLLLEKFHPYLFRKFLIQTR